MLSENALLSSVAARAPPSKPPPNNMPRDPSQPPRRNRVRRDKTRSLRRGFERAFQKPGHFMVLSLNERRRWLPS